MLGILEGTATLVEGTAVLRYSIDVDMKLFHLPYAMPLGHMAETGGGDATVPGLHCGPVGVGMMVFKGKTKRFVEIRCD
jgi:hypothetical protein